VFFFFVSLFLAICFVCFGFGSFPFPFSLWCV
jgi:hypothetical protein